MFRTTRALPRALAMVVVTGAAVALAVGPAAADIVVEGQDAEQGSGNKISAPVVIEEDRAHRDDWSVTTVAIIRWPTTGSTPFDISDGFGYRVSPIAGASTDHKGVDFTPGRGTEIVVISEGTVVQAGSNGGLGQAVTVEHLLDGQAVTTIYGHMQRGSIRVQPGQRIERGTVLGTVGSTGISTGDHLHFEVHLAGIPVDPYDWLQKHANEQSWEGLD